MARLWLAVTCVVALTILAVAGCSEDRRTNPIPPPIAAPFTRAIVGCGSEYNRCMHSEIRAESSRFCS